MKTSDTAVGAATIAIAYDTVPQVVTIRALSESEEWAHWHRRKRTEDDPPGRDSHLYWVEEVEETERDTSHLYEDDRDRLITRQARVIELQRERIGRLERQVERLERAGGA